jgi:hypothetical protein
MVDDRQPRPAAIRKKNRMPANSVFYEKIVPIILIAFGIVMAGLILFAAGVLLGLIHY